MYKFLIAAIVLAALAAPSAVATQKGLVERDWLIEFPPTAFSAIDASTDWTRVSAADVGEALKPPATAWSLEGVSSRI